ncbi:hypothetical protein SAY87_008396 [Trapa incisa]|uniref:Uncharacterized protein n=1 Tax=Trapa incisa TaxID=236973 RepID=A0AAN7KKH7_9MYRT|nr:hypothetical protein SAY87_008396 [Trapa incisa]
MAIEREGRKTARGRTVTLSGFCRLDHEHVAIPEPFARRHEEADTFLFLHSSLKCYINFNETPEHCQRVQDQGLGNFILAGIRSAYEPQPGSMAELESRLGSAACLPPRAGAAQADEPLFHRHHNPTFFAKVKLDRYDLGELSSESRNHSIKNFAQSSKFYPFLTILGLARSDF